MSNTKAFWLMLTGIGMFALVYLFIAVIAVKNNVGSNNTHPTTITELY